MIGVVDYRAGNAPSVMYALARLGIDARLVSDADAVREVDRIILPGVGAAGATVASLTESGLVDALTERVLNEAIPFLGICVGLQILFEHSEEGDTDCLGWLPGKVQSFPASVRVPQIGWNSVRFVRDHALTKGLPEDPYLYFVNSFHAVPADADDVLGVTDYAGEFCSVVAHKNIAATQFHAEKSGEVGLRILTNFATWSGF
ncbi:imidazole glycerol phosphate synthase, glutamine amidotransferase subunit [Actinobacteria bacterium IMCC26256]|nr:imidazole glycerol phosphate synthase, glutamine amidotransferase subunit [Actinobacteria bacterium IMCC26256]